MYGQNTDEVTAWGWRIDQIEGITDIWPCNASAYFVFEAMRTQWRVALVSSAGGSYAMPCGLEYAVLPMVMLWHDIPKEDHAEVFADIRVMEDAALQVMREK